MSINRNNTKVKNVFFGSLPEYIQSNVVNICKVVKDTINNELKKDLYSELRASAWAMSTIDHFSEKPKDKYPVGSCRVFKSGTTYRATIQLTNTFPNKEYGWMEELMHGFLKNTFTDVRKNIRKQFDLTIVNNGELGSDLEGFSLSLGNKEAKSIWDYLSDVPEKNYITELTNLPILEDTLYGLQNKVNNTITKLLNENDDKYSNLLKESLKGAMSNNIQLENIIDEATGVNELSFIPLTEYVKFDGTKKEINYVKNLFTKIASKLNNKLNDNTKEIMCLVEGNNPIIGIGLTNEYAYLLEKKLNERDDKLKPTETKDEVKSNNTIDSIANDIISNKKVTQSDLNVCAEIINKNYFNKWAKYFNKVKLILTNSDKPSVSFKIPPINSKTVADLINGKTTIFMYLHRNSDIEIKISSKAILTMKEPHQLFKFLESAIKYYNNRINKYGVSVLSPILKLQRPIKQLICDGKLDSVIRIPLVMLFTFDNIDLSSPNNFKLSKSDIQAIRKLGSGIINAYNSNKENKDNVIKTIKKVIAELRKYVHSDDKNILKGIAESVEDFYNGKFDQDIKDNKDKWIYENTLRVISKDPKVKYYSEAWGVKKLKKIPMSVVAYVQIEGEAIKDANDKYMIAAYCLSKIELIEWYIELLNTGSKKYIVPHNKQYLESMRNALLKAYNDIMKRPIPKADRPIVDINYSKLESIEYIN